MVKLNTPATLPQGKNPYTLNRQLGGPQGRSECRGKDKNFLASARIGPPTVQPDYAVPFYLTYYEKLSCGVDSVSDWGGEGKIHRRLYVCCAGIWIIGDS